MHVFVTLSPQGEGFDTFRPEKCILCETSCLEGLQIPVIEDRVNLEDFQYMCACLYICTHIYIVYVGIHVYKYVCKCITPGARSAWLLASH